MPFTSFNPKLSGDADRAVRSAFDAVSTWNAELAAGNERVVKKLAAAGRAVGWPDYVVDAIVAQMEGMTKLQIHMTDHLLEAWQEQIKSPHPMAGFPSVMMAKLQSWPGLASQGTWPSFGSWGGFSQAPAQFWVQLAEQWQKNWAQAMTTWAVSSRAKINPDE